MPSGDKKGPLGFGSMTGRGAGYCTGHGVPGYMNPAGRVHRGRGDLGFGRGRGYGMGCRNIYYDPLDSKAAGEAEESCLRSRAEFLKGNLNSLEKRLKELETEKDTDKEIE
ncbi:MAG: DUF5320 domain-containing protein [Spirochaetes bacterium]|nr:DUF5320 domain-containing protein [Spirochaetota bacterium]